MNARVDVLAVMDQAAFRIENLREVAGFEPSVLPPQVREARAAVAELIAAAHAYRRVTVGKATTETSARLDAALARVQP